jgi:hypothetical protein
LRIDVNICLSQAKKKEAEEAEKRTDAWATHCEEYVIIYF